MRNPTITPRPAIALAGLSLLLLLTGCSSDSGAGGDASGSGELSSGTEQQAFDEWNAAFDDCMKEQGIDLERFRSHADDGSGSSGESDGHEAIAIPDDFDLALYESANETCTERVGAPPVPPGAPEQEELQEMMLAFAACMREAGYDYPDPEFDGGGAVAAMPADEYDPADLDRCTELAGLDEARG